MELYFSSFAGVQAKGVLGNLASTHKHDYTLLVNF